MRTNEIKRTIEEVVRIEYIAADGEVFNNKEECKKYEESALFTVSSRLKKLSKKYTSLYDLNDDCSDEYELEIFNVETETDLINLRQYLYLKATKQGASEKYIEPYFTNFNDITIGHEVLIFWGYDGDCFYTYGDGSLNGYLDYLRDRYTKIITPEEENKQC